MRVAVPFFLHIISYFSFILFNPRLGGVAALTLKSLGLSADNIESLFAAAYHNITVILTGHYITFIKPVLW